MEESVLYLESSSKSTNTFTNVTAEKLWPIQSPTTSGGTASSLPDSISYRPTASPTATGNPKLVYLLSGKSIFMSQNDQNESFTFTPTDSPPKPTAAKPS